MMKEEVKSIIRHELLNIFTIISIFTSNGKNLIKDRKEVLQLINASSLIIAYENIFLGKKMKAHKDIFSLQEVLELLSYVYKKDFNAKKIKFSLNINGEGIVKGDKRLFKESIELIIKRIIGCTSLLKIDYIGKKKQLIISYKCKKCAVLKRGDLVKSLLQKEYKTGGMGFQLALRLLDSQGIKTKITNNQVTLQLK